jgi:hypothetical protein
MSENQQQPPVKRRPWHELVAEMWIADPNLSQREIARTLNRTECWLSILVNSDSFKHYLAMRKEEIVDPILRATVEDRLTSVANKAAELFLERLHMAGTAIPNKDLLRAMEISTKGLGMGPVSKGPALQQNLYVIPAPQRAATSTEWVEMVEKTLPGPIPT